MTIFEKIRQLFSRRKQPKLSAVPSLRQIRLFNYQMGQQVYRGKGRDAVTIVQAVEELEDESKRWERLSAKVTGHPWENPNYDQLTEKEATFVRKGDPLAKMFYEAQGYAALPWYKKLFMSPAKRRAGQRARAAAIYCVTFRYTDPNLTNQSKPVYANAGHTFVNFIKRLFRKNKAYRPCWSVFQSAEKRRLSYQKAQREKAIQEKERRRMLEKITINADRAQQKEIEKTKQRSRMIRAEIAEIKRRMQEGEQMHQETMVKLAELVGTVNRRRRQKVDAIPRRFIELRPTIARLQLMALASYAAQKSNMSTPVHIARVWMEHDKIAARNGLSLGADGYYRYNVFADQRLYDGIEPADRQTIPDEYENKRRMYTARYR